MLFFEILSALVESVGLSLEAYLASLGGDIDLVVRSGTRETELGLVC